MTGSEAWDLVSPILAQYLNRDSDFIKAYATIFVALLKFDETGEQNEHM